jgi:hypothetical protein
MEVLYVQNRQLEAKDLEWIRQLIDAHPNWNRTKLSRHIAQSWQWRNQAGQLKDMACRTMLLKLEQKGLLCLPARQRPSNNHCACRSVALPIAQPVVEPIESQLNVLEPLCIVPAQSREALTLFDWLLWRYHYLPYSSGALGENIKYLVFDCRARPLACLLYGAAAWKLSVRDQFIGWTKQQREANLCYLANNLRFLILPWVRVKNLASRLLSASLSMLSGHWQLKYGHPIYLAETFVECERFRGTCYRAANWSWLGQTQGRGRNDRSRQLSVPIKDIYVRTLCKDFRQRLSDSRVPRPTPELWGARHRLATSCFGRCS